MITLLPFERLSLWNTLTMIALKHSTLITATLFQVVTVRHFDNDCFETFPHWSLCYPFLGCHCETLWQWLFWNTSTLITLLPFFRLSLWNTLTMTVLKHFHMDHFTTLFQVVTVKHFDNDCFETFPHWSLCFSFFRLSLWKTLTMNVLKHFHIDHFAFLFLCCHFETLWQWLFWNISTWITLLPFFRLSLWNTLTMIVLKHFHFDHCYPFSGCHCETLWQWLLWNTSTLITLLPFFRLSLWSTLTMTVLKHFHIDHCYPFSGCHCETLWQWLFWNTSTLITLLPVFRLSLWNTLTMTVLKHFHNDHFATRF